MFDMGLPAALFPKGFAAVHRRAAWNGDAVLEEHAIELAALGHARHVGEQAEIHIGLAVRVGMAPAGRMAAGDAEECAKAQLPALRRRHGLTVLHNSRRSCS